MKNIFLLLALTLSLLSTYAQPGKNGALVVSAANTVEVKFTNTTGSAINPANMVYYITVIR